MKKKLLIFEGCDRAFKSTTIAAITKDPAFKLIETPRKVANVCSSADWSFFDYMKNLPQGPIYVLDRHVHSNYAYNGMRQGRTYNPSYDLELLLAYEKAFDVFHAILLRKPCAIADDLISLTYAQDKVVIDNYIWLSAILNTRTYRLTEQPNDLQTLKTKIKMWQKED